MASLSMAAGSKFETIILPTHIGDVFTITAPASTGPQTYSCPINTRALLFLGVGGGGTTDGYVADYGLFVGAATASGTGNQWCISGSEDDGSNQADSVEASSNAKCIYFAKYNAGTGTITLAAALTAIDTALGTFTLNWTTTVSGAKVRVMAIGGTDVLAKAGTFNRRTTTGTLGVTGVGFAPDTVFHGLTRNANDEASQANLRMGIGVTGVIGEQWAIFNTCQDAVATTNDTGRLITTKAGMGYPAGGGTSNYEFSIDSYDSDGFTTNFSIASGSAERVHYLAFKGVSVDVGSMTQPVAGGAQNQDSPSLGINPFAVLLASINMITNTAIQNNNRLSIGIADGTDVAGIWSGSFKSSSAATSDAFSDDNSVLRMATEGTPTTNADADTLIVGSDKFTLHWSTIDATARQFTYWALGPTTNPNLVDSEGLLVIDNAGNQVIV